MIDIESLATKIKEKPDIISGVKEKLIRVHKKIETPEDLEFMIKATAINTERTKAISIGNVNQAVYRAKSYISNDDFFFI